MQAASPLNHSEKSAVRKIVGLLGVGTINGAIAEGILGEDQADEILFTTARGAIRVAALQQRFPGRVTICNSNHECIDNADLVLIGVLPIQVEGVLRELRFREDHLIVSLYTLPQRGAGSAFTIRCPGQ